MKVTRRALLATLAIGAPVVTLLTRPSAAKSLPASMDLSRRWFPKGSVKIVKNIYPVTLRYYNIVGIVEYLLPDGHALCQIYGPARLPCRVGSSDAAGMFTLVRKGTVLSDRLTSGTGATIPFWKIEEPA